MSEIDKKLGHKLAQAGLTDEALRRQSDAGFVARSEDGKKLELSVPAIAEKPDTLELQLTHGEQKGPQLSVESSSERDLDTRGKWQVFSIDPRELAKAAAPAGTLDAVMVRAKLPGSDRSYTFSLAFLLSDVMLTGAIGLRAKAPWPNSVPNSEALRQVMMLSTAPGQPVQFGDERIPAEDYLAARKRIRELDRLRTLSGFDSIEQLLGFEITTPLPPLRQVARTEVAVPEGRLVSAEAEAYLTRAGHPPPEDGVLTVAWAEAANDLMLDHEPPKAVAEELVALYLRAQDEQKNAASMFSFGDTAESAPSGGAKKLNRGAGEIDRAKEARKRRIEDQLGKLLVPESVAAQLGEQLVLALEPRRSGLIIVAGPRKSASDALEKVALREVGPRALQVTDELTADPGFPGLFAQGLINRDGIASAIAPEKLEEHRLSDPRGGDRSEWSAAAHVPIEVGSLETVGQKAPVGQRRQLIQQLLKRFFRATDLNQPISVNNKGGRGTDTTTLPQCVVVARWPAAPDVPVSLGVDGNGQEVRTTLNEVLADPDLKALAALGRVVSWAPDAREQHAAYLEWATAKSLPFEVEVIGADKRKRSVKPEVTLGAEVRKQLFEALEGGGDAYRPVIDRVLPELTALSDDLSELPRAARYEVQFGDQLTEKGRARVFTGKRPPVGRIFELVPVGGVGEVGGVGGKA